MNVVAGLVIGLLAPNLSYAVGYSVVWAVFHVVYGYLLGAHENPVVDSTEGGNPVVAYYGARLATGLLTAGGVALATFLLTRFLT
jgi:hypothetical protein